MSRKLISLIACLVLVLSFGVVPGAAQEAEPPITGYHDYDQGDVPGFACNVGGWAMYPDDLEAVVTVRIVVDGSLLIEVAADGYREDLETAWDNGWGGCPGGNCGFEVSLWDDLTHYEAHEILVEAWDGQSGNWYPLVGTPRTLNCRTYDIYAYDPLTGEVTQITYLEDSDEYNPSWSPNGKLVAHDVLAGDQHDIYITDVKTGVSTPLTGAEGGNDAVWSPNGKWIAFDGGLLGDQSLYIIPSEGGVATLVRENAVSADWAPNGKRLVFQQPSDGSIHTISVDGGKGGETTIAMSGANPVWSPDGNWIAYDDGGDIWKVSVNVKGTVFSDPIQVTSSFYDDGQPTWSMDSGAIIYSSGNGQNYDLWTVPSAGGKPAWLTGAIGFGDYDPANAKNSSTIAYASFSLDLGGAISGTIYEADGVTPIPNVHVDACDWADTFCMGTEADENGNYTISGLLEGDYRVFVWGGQGGWIDEFYFDTPFHHEAWPVTVTAGVDTGGIDFTMEIGGTISGTIYEADGVTPIPNVHVDACDWADTFCMGADADENGNYTISGLLEGDYRVFVWGGQGGWVDEFYFDTPFHHEATAVNVTPGADIYGIDFTMEIGGTISGTVYEADGVTPIPNVHVDACDWADTFCMGADADENGNYTIMGLPGGDYRVSVWGGQGGWIDEFYDDTPFHHEATAVNVTPGADMSGIDFTMEIGGTISGTVYETDGVTPIPNVHVDACDWADTFCMGAESDEYGNYTIAGLPGGDYRVSVWGGQGSWIDEFYFDTPFHHEAWPVTVTAGVDAGGIDFTMEVGGTISGTVYEANSGDPLATIAGVHVDACSTDDTFCNGTETGDAGEYTITGLLPDKEYRVFIWGQPGWASEVYQETIWWDQATIVTPDATGIDFTLDPGGSISGLVTDADGNPLADIGVDIMDGGFGSCSDENGYYSIMGLPFGTYEIVAGRDFCGPHPYAEQVMSGITIDEENPDIGGLDFELVLGGSISGTITAVGGGSVDEEIHLSACFEDDSFCGWASMQDDGTYVITGLLEGEYRVHAYQWPIGNWVGEVFDNTQDWDAFTPVSVTAGQDTPNIDFELQLGGSITGMVTAVGGGLIEDNIDMSACFEDGSFCGWASVQSDGTYEIIGLLPGEYRVNAHQWPKGYWIDEVYEETRDWDAYTPVSVVAGGETSGIDFTLELGGGITGVVEDGDGNPIVGVWVVANDYAGDYFVSWGKTDVTGTYRILELPAGTYRVFLDPQNGWTGQEYSPSPVTVVAGLDTLDVDFTLAPDSTISGTVTDVDGNHIPERIDVAACWVTAPDVCFWTTVLVDSTYTIIGLPSGEFYVNTYEVPEDGVPWGNWIGYTYDTTITLGVDVDVVDIDFMLSQQE